MKVAILACVLALGLCHQVLTDVNRDGILEVRDVPDWWDRSWGQLEPRLERLETRVGLEHRLGHAASQLGSRSLERSRLAQRGGRRWRRQTCRRRGLERMGQQLGRLASRHHRRHSRERLVKS